ncbi:hypothetical protein PLICRDRAFT_36468 [Plicaturopsis crispa FD-325 SS-3]|nr:hypothetical protein PLICRDRAFT_36468 [Plicaturopsis crispa FD-325 SS-3]
MSEETSQQPTKKHRINAFNAGRILSSTPKRSQTLPASSSQVLHRSKPKGKLRLLPSLPLDILFEIFGHLLPLDLLHLARTTKSFRGLLMRKSSTSMWKASRRNVEGLLDCPKDLCEPAYAFLAFDTRCHNCSVVGIHYVNWALRARYCGRCAKTCLILYDDSNDETVAEEISRECVTFADWPSNGNCCTVDARDRMLKEGAALNHEDAVTFAAFLKRVHDEMEAVKQHALLCEKWERARIVQREAELNSLRNTRQEAILSKLRELGYSKVIEKMPRCRTEWTYDDLFLLSEHPLVRQPKPLTERIWNNIKDEMIKWMEQMKDYLVKDKRRRVLSARKEFAMSILRRYKETHRTSDISLGPLDFFDWAEVKQILDRKDTKRVCAEDFSRVLEKLPVYIEQWRTAVSRDLVLKAGAEGAGAPLDLAVHVFRCTWNLCPHHSLHSLHNPEGSADLDRLWYPEVLHHRCCGIKTYTLESPLQPDPVDVIGIWYHFLVRQKWNIERLVFDDKASRVVRRILEACGLDASVATVADIDALDPRLVCLKCSYGSRCDGERIFPVRRRLWGYQVYHCLRTHWGDSSVRWERISDQDAMAACRKEQDNIVNNPLIPERAPQWQCLRCIDTPDEVGPMTKAHLWNHMNMIEELDKEECEEGEDYALYRGLATISPPTVKLTPRGV